MQPHPTPAATCLNSRRDRKWQRLAIQSIAPFTPSSSAKGLGEVAYLLTALIAINAVPAYHFACLSMNSGRTEANGVLGHVIQTYKPESAI